MAEQMHEVPVWSSGMMSFDGRILEVTTSDGLRIAAGDLEGIELGKTRKGRLNVKDPLPRRARQGQERRLGGAGA